MPFNATGRAANLAHLAGNARFRLVTHAVERPPAIDGAFDWVMHFASPASPPRYLERPIETLRVIAEGTYNLLELATERGSRFLLASTSEVYGDPAVDPQPESYWGKSNPIGPRSVYDEGKRYAEALTMAIQRARGLNTRLIRIFNTYGPRMDPGDGRVVSNFVVQALRGEPLTIYGGGRQTRSFQYIDDLIAGIVRLMCVPHHEPLNLGNPEEHTMLELAALVQRVCGSDAPLLFAPLPEDDPKQRQPDIARARALLGWEPRVSLEEGLTRTVRCYDQASRLRSRSSFVAEAHPSGPFLHARWYGTPIKRREDPRLITGSAGYIDDIQQPGTLHLAFVRSPHAHARIGVIDASAALAMPGVVAVIGGEEAAQFAPPFPPNSGYKQPPRFVLAQGKVRRVGEAVAAVLAEDRYTAEDAVDAVAVDYEPLPAVIDPEAAMAPGAPQLWDEFPGNAIVKDAPFGSGDVDAAFAQADVVVSQRMTCARLAPAAIETRGVLAAYQKWDRSLTLWSTTQAPHRARAIMAEMTGLPEGQIRVIAPEMGGGFGAKGNVYHEEALACFLAMRFNRPIKWIETRMESFNGTSHGRGQVGYVELAAKRDGTLLGLKLRVIADLGHTCDLSTAGLLGNTARLASNVYRIPAVRVTLTEALTNKTPTAAYRGAGRPEAVYFMERAIDLLARELGMDPIALRRKNFIPRDAFPYTTALGLTYDSGDYARALDALLENVSYDELIRQRDAAQAEGRLVGIGLSTYVESCGPPAPDKGGGAMAFEFGAVRVGRSGAVELLTGVSAHGQGHETVFGQLAAEILGVSPEVVTLHEHDTAVVSQGVGTFGSRSMVMGGSAVYLALRDVEAKMRRIAAGMIEANEEDLRFREGRIEPVDAPERGVSFARVAAQAYAAPLPGDEPGLEAQHYYASQGMTFPFGAYLCMAEVDRDTGAVTLLRFDGVDDCGPVINPLIVHGQVHGGIAQGVGQALMEEVVYDADGNLVSGSFLDYAIPQAREVPWMRIEHTVTPSPLTPLGLKGVGEAGTIGSVPAIANAVLDALAPLGVRHIDLPLTPQRVWQAISTSPWPR
jgi:carbon-monoxide dehydrogenase large subunit